MDWSTFEREHDFDNTLFNATRQALLLLSQSDFKDATLFAFAFNAVSYPGISLSVDTSAGSREQGLYPPDWTNECVETEVPAISELWQASFAQIDDDIVALIDATDDDDVLDTFEAGYLHSLRSVMLRLERSAAFDVIDTGEPFWTLVTQVDADTDQEEALLEQLRQSSIG